VGEAPASAAGRRGRSKPIPVPAPIPTPAPDPPPPTPEPDTILKLTSEPTEAKVYLGGRFIGQTPMQISTLAPDSDQQLVVEKDGYEDSLLKVRLEKGKTDEKTVTLKKKVHARRR
jgi:hypothetical protein